MDSYGTVPTPHSIGCTGQYSGNNFRMPVRMMDKRFDIFWFGEGGPTWVDAVATFESAKACIEKLPQRGDSGAYAVLDLRTGNRISFVKTRERNSAVAASA